jgi:hypothetical protein
MDRKRRAYLFDDEFRHNDNISADIKCETKMSRRPRHHTRDVEHVKQEGFRFGGWIWAGVFDFIGLKQGFGHQLSQANKGVIAINAVLSTNQAIAVVWFSVFLHPAN